MKRTIRRRDFCGALAGAAIAGPIFAAPQPPAPGANQYQVVFSGAIPLLAPHWSAINATQFILTRPSWYRQTQWSMVMGEPWPSVTALWDLGVKYHIYEIQSQNRCCFNVSVWRIRRFPPHLRHKRHSWHEANGIVNERPLPRDPLLTRTIAMTNVRTTLLCDWRNAQATVTAVP